MAAAAIFYFWNRKILLVNRVRKVETHQQAKFCQNRSIGCEDINFFWFFKMATAAILHFRNRDFLFAASICRAQTHHCTKYRQNRSFHCGDIAVFRIFKMAPAAIFDFWNREILLVIVTTQIIFDFSVNKYLTSILSTTFLSGWIECGDASARQILSKSVNWLRRY